MPLIVAIGCSYNECRNSGIYERIYDDLNKLQSELIKPDPDCSFFDGTNSLFQRTKQDILVNKHGLCERDIKTLSEIVGSIELSDGYQSCQNDN